MGAGASQSFFEKDETGLEVPDAPDNIKALAARLSLAHGINKAILVHGLVAVLGSFSSIRLLLRVILADVVWGLFREEAVVEPDSGNKVVGVRST